MKRSKVLVLMLASAAVILSSCTNTVYVTKKSTMDKSVNEVKADLANMGYAPSGSSTDTKNNLYVEGTTYSQYSGYGSKMANEYVTTDTYRFTHEDGSTMNYSISYKLKQDATKGLIYVTEVSTAGCESSNPKKYDQLCGSGSPIQKIDTLPQDASIEVPDLVGNTFLGIGLGTLACIMVYVILL